MKILQLVTSRKYRGAEISAAQLSAKLVENGHELYFYGLFPSGEEIPLSVQGAENGCFNGHKEKAISLSLLKDLRKLVLRIEPEIIQANGSDTLKYAFAATWGLKKPRLIYRNISQMSYWLGKRPILQRIYNRTFYSFSALVSVGEKSQRDLMQLFPVHSQKCKVIKRGIDLNASVFQKGREEVLKELNLSPNIFVLVQVGSLTPEKNISFSIELLETLVTKDPNFHLLIIGSGPEEKQLKTQVKNSELETHISFLGFRKDIDKFLMASDLLLLTSLVEGIPGVVLESGGQGSPAICVDVGGVSEVVIHDQTGILIQGHSVQQFSNAILDLKGNAKKLNQLGKAARSFVEVEHDLDLQSRKFEKLYQSVLNES